MNRINPSRLRHFRKKQNLSLEGLSKESKTDKGTIHRIEKGEVEGSRVRTVKQLADALGIEPSDLTNPETLITENGDKVGPYETQLNVKISYEARNALMLVCDRYKIKQYEVFEFAPLLFHLLAKESLKQRKNRLSETRSLRKIIESLANKFPHISERIVESNDSIELEELEQESIQAHDIRGERIGHSKNNRRLNYDAYGSNPFVSHIRERLQMIEDKINDEIVGWSSHEGIHYKICRDQALDWFGGDDDAADEFISGCFLLNEMPREVRDGSPTERATWARNKRAKNSATELTFD